MAVIRRNFLTGNTSVVLSAGGTTLTSADLAALPVVAAPDYAWISLDPQEEHGLPEIVKVTAHSSGSVSATIQRGQQQDEGGGPPREHPSGSFWAHATTALDLTDPSSAQTVINVKDPAYGAVGDGVANDTAAIAAAIAALPTTGGVVYFPVGTYKVTNTIVAGGTTGVQRNARHFIGAGTASVIAFVGTFTDGFRLSNSSNSSIENLHFSAPATVTNVVHITTDPNSTEVVNLDNVFVEGGTNCFAVGADTANDVSEITFLACDGANAANAAFLIGNGSSGNVLDIRMFGCVARNSVYGVYAHGTAFTWHGGTALGNSGADFKYGTPGGAPVLIAGVRSEGSKKFWEMTGGATYGGTSVTFLGIVVASFSDPDGKVIEHSSSVPLSIIGGSYRGPTAAGPPTTKINAGFSPDNPCILTAIGVITDNPVNPFTNNESDNGSEAPFVIRNIIGCGSSAGGAVAMSDINNMHRDALVTMNTGGQNPPVFNARNGSVFQYRMTANVASSTITNPKLGQVITIEWLQDDTGSRTYVWPANCKFAGGAAPAASVAVDKRDSVTFRYDGTNWLEIARAVGVG